MRKIKHIQGLVQRLPGGERGDGQQEADVKRLAEQLQEVEKEKKESRRKMRELARRFDNVVNGMDTNIEVETIHIN